jgi:hypothetical protein
MQVLQAGEEKYVLLELESETMETIAGQVGFAASLEESSRSWQMTISAPDRTGPLLLFDAADPGNLGWFSRCQFYVDGASGSVLQTPIALSNIYDKKGNLVPYAMRVHIAKELPVRFKLPGRVGVSEQVMYQVLYNFLHALQNTGVGLCGGPSVKALAGRNDAPPVRG